MYSEYEIDIKEFIQKHYLSDEEYQKLLVMADAEKQITLKYIIRVLSEMGLNYDSLKELTVESLKTGRVLCKMKGDKICFLSINSKLQKELLNYCEQMSIQTGSIFVDKKGMMLDKAHWIRKFYKLADAVHIDREKVGFSSFRIKYVMDQISKLKIKSN